MLKIHELREIIRLVDQSSIQEFDLESEGTKINIKKGAAFKADTTAVPIVQAPPTPVAVQPVHAGNVAPVQEEQKETPNPTEQLPVAKAPVTSEENYHKIVSPMVGTFYSKSEPSAPSFVNVGDKVKSDTVVCIVEAMKLFNEIEAEVTGEIVKVLVTDGQLVEYGQPLFLVKAE
jgi:acetyl-CoA carboxylase biotin carboxyl carrier protein